MEILGQQNTENRKLSSLPIISRENGVFPQLHQTGNIKITVA
jgi:hypothetical protein